MMAVSQLRNGLEKLCSTFTCKCMITRAIQTTPRRKIITTTANNSTYINEVSSDTSPVVQGQSLPIITSRKVDAPGVWREPRQAWVESLNTVEDEKLGIVDLHPDVFATYPRVDLIHRNVLWQKDYRRIRYDRVKNRAEMRGGGRKPWPQKGLGKSQAGSIRAPNFKGGGISHGPRGPESYYYMLPRSLRVKGLCCTLSVKFAQNDLHVVDTLELPSEEPEYLQELIRARRWGLSVLFVDDVDIIPKSMAIATAGINHFNVMPVYGLNVHSMLKHETLILTLAAVEKLEEKLVGELHRPYRETSYKDKVVLKDRR